MADGNRSKRKRVNGFRVLVAFLVIGLLGIGAVSAKSIVELHVEQRALEKENARLEQQKADLQAELKSLDDLDYIEEQARKQLRMIKPGEVLFVLDEDRSAEVREEEQELLQEEAEAAKAERDAQAEADAQADAEAGEAGEDGDGGGE